MKSKEPTVHGPSQQNITVDPAFERVKAEIKADIMPKEHVAAKPSKRPRSTFITDYL